MILHIQQKIKPAALGAKTVVLHAVRKSVSAQNKLGIIHIQKGDYLKIRHVPVIVCKILQAGHINRPCMHLHKMGCFCIRHEPVHRAKQIYREDCRK